MHINRERLVKNKSFNSIDTYFMKFLVMLIAYIHTSEIALR